MPSKYLVSGSPLYTTSNRTIALSGATMSTALDINDEVRQLFFRSGTSLWNGRIEKFVDANTLRLLASGNIPTTDVTIAEMFVMDFGELHTYNDYIARVSSMIQDAMGKLTTTSGGDLDKAIAQAVETYSAHVPFYVSKKVTGTGSQNYLLSTIFGSLWLKEFSFISSIEFPSGSNPEEMLDANDYSIYDDGTAQDGTNLILRFKNETPLTTQSFVVKILVDRSLPRGGTQNFPDTNYNFMNITTLAASLCCAALAASFAQSIDKSISVDAVAMSEKTRKYMELAKMYLAQYKAVVFGSDGEGEKDIMAATGEKHYEITTSAGTPYVFHIPPGSM